MHSPSTASGVATALRASKSRQNHSSVCSGSPLRSRPVKGQPPAPNARLGAAPPCELQPRRWPTQLTLREACPGSGMKRGVFFRPSSRLNTWQEFSFLVGKLSFSQGNPFACACCMCTTTCGMLAQREWCRLAVGVVGEQWDALSILAGAEGFLRLVLHLPGFCFEPWVAIRGKEYCLDGAR